MNRLVLLSIFSYITVSLSAQSLVVLSGNGQLVNSSYPANAPLVVQAKDASGNPAKGVAIDWSVTKGGLILTFSTPSTDASGLASTTFTGIVLQPNQSFIASTVTASSSYGTVSFIVTTVPSLDFSTGDPVPQPTVQLITPALGSTLSAPAGTTLPGALVVKVGAAYGVQAGVPIPNINLQIVNADNPALTPPAHCNGPANTVLTDSTGTASCNLVVTGQPGTTTRVEGEVGNFHYTAPFDLMITAGASCSFSLSSSSQAISSMGGSGSVNVATTSTCGWTATSNAGFISISSGASGMGNGTVSYNVAADSGTPRSGTLTIAGQTFTVNQGAGAAGPLAITTAANLPGGAVNQSYATTLAAAGGIPPYSWSITEGALPAGIILNPSTGLLSGAATAAGASSFTATVQDSAGTKVSLAFSLTISAASSSFEITNTSFPNGVVQQPYNQALTAVGGEITPFAPYPSFRISGGALPAGLSIMRNPDLSSSIIGTPTTVGVSSFTLTAADAGANTTSANFTITITGTPVPSEQMTVSPATLAFTVQLGSASVPPVQNVSITGSSTQLNYTSIVITGSGGGWLVVQNSTSGNTPGTLQVGVANYSNLQPGPYSGTITVSSQAANSPQAVQVTLTVLAAPSLTIAPQNFAVSEGQSSASNVTRQTIQVSAGADTLSFSTAAITASGGNWLTVSPQTGTTPASLTVSVEDGGLGIGTYTGTITVTPASGTAQTVTLTLNVISPEMLSATPAPIAFSYPLGSQPPVAQSVTVSNNGTATLNVSTAVATTNNGTWLFVSPGSGSTPLALSVSVNPSGLAYGTYQGTIIVTASDDSVTPLAIPVTLNVAAPRPTIASVTNGASFTVGPVAPGEIVTIFGSGLGPYVGVTGSSTSGPTKNETEVQFNSFIAPILYSSDTQVSVLVPYELAGASSASMTLIYAVNGVDSLPTQVTVANSAPGIFTMNSSGQGQGAIINQDGSINSATNAAAPGSIVSIYASGEGQTSPAGVDGAINGGTLPLPAPLLPVTVEIGGLPAVVEYAGGAPLEIEGLFQVNVKLPAGVATGASVPVVLTVGTASSQTGVTMAIHP